MKRDQDSTAKRPFQNSAFFAVFPSIMLPMFLAVMDQTIVATALPAISASTGNVQRASWVVVSYLLASTIAAPIYGRLGDAFGRRRLLFAALWVFIAASLLCAASPTIELLTLARIVQGFGGGGLVTGGYLTQHFGWPSIFLVNAPIGIVAVLLARALPQYVPQHSKWRPDPAGLLFFTIFVSATLFALEQAQRLDPQTLPLMGALLAVGLIALVLLIRQETSRPSPLIPLGLLRRPAVWRTDALAACHGAALVSLITFLPVHLEVVRGHSPAETGLILVPLTIGIGCGSLLTGRLVSMTGLTTVFPASGLVLVTANLVAFALWADTIGTYMLAGFLVWNGLFMGTVMGVVQVTVQSASGPRRLGEAAASVQFSRSMGAAFGTAFVGSVLFAVLGMRNPEAARTLAAMVERAGADAPSLSAIGGPAAQMDIARAFRAAFLTIAGLTALGVVLALTIPLRRL